MDIKLQNNQISGSGEEVKINSYKIHYPALVIREKTDFWADNFMYMYKAISSQWVKQSTLCWIELCKTAAPAGNSMNSKNLLRMPRQAVAFLLCSKNNITFGMAYNAICVIAF